MKAFAVYFLLATGCVLLGGAGPVLADAPAVVMEASSATAYRFIAATAFHPRDGLTTHRYGVFESVYITAATGDDPVMTMDLSLPHGATVTQLRLYFSAVPATGCDAWIIRSTGLGSALELARVRGMGTGAAMKVDADANFVVDTANYSYALNWGPDAAGSGTRLYGVRVAYTPPPGSRAVVAIPMEP